MPQSGRRPQHQKQTFKRFRPMSALLPKADIGQRDCHVRFVPKADIGTAVKKVVFSETQRFSRELAGQFTARWRDC
jgi:hypothetical protein